VSLPRAIVREFPGHGWAGTMINVGEKWPATISAEVMSTGAVSAAGRPTPAARSRTGRRDQGGAGRDGQADGCRYLRPAVIEMEVAARVDPQSERSGGMRGPRGRGSASPGPGHLAGGQHQGTHRANARQSPRVITHCHKHGSPPVAVGQD
jgi:hypothetical protein